METPEQKKSFESACQEILAEPKIRFVGLINRMGSLVVEKYRQGVESYLKEREDRMLSMELALEVFLREEFNEKLGEIDYVLSKRKKVNLISVPVGKYLLLISTDPGVDVDALVAISQGVFEKLLK